MERKLEKAEQDYNKRRKIWEYPSYVVGAIGIVFIIISILMKSMPLAYIASGIMSLALILFSISYFVLIQFRK